MSGFILLLGTFCALPGSRLVSEPVSELDMLLVLHSRKRRCMECILVCLCVSVCVRVSGGLELDCDDMEEGQVASLFRAFACLRSWFGSWWSFRK